MARPACGMTDSTSDHRFQHDDVPFRVAVGGDHRGRAKNRKVDWSTLGEMLRMPHLGEETVAEFDALDKEDQGKRKAEPGFISGSALRDGRRKRGHMLPRRTFIYDLDDVSQETVYALTSRSHDACAYAFYVHSTRRDRAWKRKLRLYLLSTDAVSEDEYGPLSRILAWQLFSRNSMTQVDPASFKPIQMMYLPSRSADQEYLFHQNAGELVDVRHLAAAWGIVEHGDEDAWRNHALLPVVPGEKTPRKPGTTATNPRLKGGVVGAFNRACGSVHGAIATFGLPYVPTGDRYTFIGSSTVAGLAIYDDGQRAYSNHATDPASGRNCSAFDLVHIHGFGERDGGVPDDTPMAERPSFTAMLEWARGLPEVRAELEAEREAKADSDLDDMAGGDAVGETNHCGAEECTGKVLPFPDEPKSRSVTLDENGIIEAFTERYRAELRFDHTSGRWHHYDGTYWKPEKTKLALHFARQVSIELARRDVKAKFLKNVHTWEAVERGARTVRDFKAEFDTWNPNHLHLGTPGGTVELATGELRAARPEDFISRLTAVAPIPLARFDPERDCPIWLAFLRHALRGDANAIRFFQQWGGYSLTGLTNLQILVFVYGPGGSGKGTAVNTLADILQDYAVNIGMETLTASRHERHTTELARLQGARMARASETEKGTAWAENRIKALTGEDVITARFMRQNDHEFKPQFKLTIFGNSRPVLKDVDQAIRRRFLILPFDNPPAERDTALGTKLRQEWPAILSWFIAGWLDLQRNGLIYPRVVAAATEEYFAQNDTFGQWLEACCKRAPGYRDTTERLWDSWARFARADGRDPGTKQGSFAETMKQHGFTPRKVAQSRGYSGLHLLPQSGEAEHEFTDDDSSADQAAGDELPPDLYALI